MAIRVTCAKCHTRFDVSENFAGKEGPCPKCKTTIKIPDLDEQVVVHAPEHSGPKDSTGKAVLKPISRSDTVLSSVQITLIVASIIAFVVAAFVLGNVFTDKVNFPIWLLAVGAFVVAMPIAYVAYTFLRNQDAAPFFGQNLWARLGVCAAVYSLLWLVMPLMCYAFTGSEEIGSIIGLAVIIAAGGVAGMFALEFDYLLGIIHYGMYIGICIVLRLIMGLSVLPKAFTPTVEAPSTVISMLLSACPLF